MERVKVFYFPIYTPATYEEELEKRINTWIAKQGDKVKITRVAFSPKADAMIFYEKK